MVETKPKMNLFMEGCKATLQEIESFHADMLGRLRELSQKIKSEELSLQESVDIGFLLRECETHLDEMRKDFKAHKDAIGKQTCYRLVMEDKDKCKGELATGSIKLSHYSDVPHPEKESERFYKLCRYFGIEPDNVPLGGLRFHWPTMKKWISHKVEQGEELPEAISEVKADLEMTYRRRINKESE